MEIFEKKISKLDLRVSPEFLERIKDAATFNGLTVAEAVREAIERWIKAEGK